MKTRLAYVFVIVILFGSISFKYAYSAPNLIIISNADATSEKFFQFGFNPELDSRIIVQYSATQKDIPLMNPSRLLEVAERVIVQGAAKLRNDKLNFPVVLVNDLLPPVISNLTTTFQHPDMYIISWDTDEYADATIHYGPEPGNYLTTLFDPLWDYDHEFTITDLNPCIPYYFKVSSSDRSGNTAESDEYSFTFEQAISELSVTNDSPTALGESTLFSATAQTGCNITYEWDFGDGQYGTGDVVTHTYQTQGDFTVVVTATNNINQLSEYSPVQIQEVIAGVTATNNSPTELGLETQLAANLISGSHQSYEWDFGDGFSGNGNPINHIFPDTGTYTATVTVSNHVSEDNASTVVEIIDRSIFGLTAINDGPTTLGEDTCFTAYLQAGSNVDYSWDFGDGYTGNGMQVCHRYQYRGTYEASVTAMNSVSQDSATTIVSIRTNSYLPFISR